MSNPLSVHMTGSEWFGTKAGGLNRYFESLFQALQEHSQVRVTSQAFGDAPPGGGSWGPARGSTMARVRTSWPSPDLEPGTILDSHFALYGHWPTPRDMPLVVHFQGPWAQESEAAGAGRLNRSLKHAVERLRYRPADRLVVLSERFKTVLVNGYAVDPTSVHVIPPGVDLGRFTVAPRCEGPPTVLCVRRLERRMGIDVLLRAWPHLLDAVPAAQLRIVGRGTDEDRLRGLAAELGLEASVYFEGTASDERLVELYQQAALTVVPTIALEGFGLIALESLAAGRAAVVTDCGGLPDAVSGLDPTLVVPPGDEDALAARVARGLQGGVPDPARCRAHAEQFSWVRAADRHVELYGTLMA